MKYTGRYISSNFPNLTINFRTFENSEQILNVLRDFQFPKQKINIRNEVETKIFTENGAAYVLLESDCRERPLKLLIDTGASITLLANDVNTKNSQVTKYIIKLFGVVRDVSIETQGLISGKFKIGGQEMESTFHLIDRKYAGPADGYLGYDFLSTYKTIIDMNEMKIIFNIKNEEREINHLCPDEGNFLNILANSYDFEETLGGQINKMEKIKKNNENFELQRLKKEIDVYGKKPNIVLASLKTYEKPMRERFILPTIHENEFEEYFEARNFYRNEIEKRIELKIGKDGSNNLKQQNFCLSDLKRSDIIYNKLNLSNCSVDEKCFIKQICRDFPLQFYVEGDMLGSTDVIEHHIKLKPDAQVVNVRQYRIPQTHRTILEEIIIDYERQGIIEKCQSPYNSPAILVEKKDEVGGKGDYRFVVDYRKLNQNTEIQNFPIPLIDDILNGLSGCSYFTTLDIKGAFHQIVLNEASRDYTAFTANNFQYRWVRMPMGLAMAPLTWQRAINTILTGLIGNGVYVYLDDVIIYAKTKFDHDKLLRQVMSLLKQHNLQLKISKCIFYAKQFEYLGHIITKDGMKANPKKIEVIKNYPRPMNVRQIQSFLGLCSYFRRYVRDFSKISRPMTFLLKKEQPFIWTEAQQKSFDMLKKALAEEVTLAFPNFSDPSLLFYVTCDSSDYAMGGCLSQGELPYDRPIFFFSKTLNDAQRRYSTIQKELLAIVECIKAFRVYIYGRFFIIITDHKPLCYLFGMKDCGSRLFRQKLELLDYNFKIIHRPGAQNNVADALSRIRPLSIDEMLELEKTEKHFAVSQNGMSLDRDMHFSIEERDGTILRKGNFDLIFHLIPRENDILKTKLIDKFGIIQFSNVFQRFHKHHFARLISNQFASSQNSSDTIECIKHILRICNDSGADNIALNVDYDNIRHYIYFTTTFKEIFASQTISVIFFLNKILELKEVEDIEKIMDLYHRSLLGGHMGGEKMYKTISRFYKWNNMVEDIKNFVRKCPICEKTKVITNVKMPMQISSLGEVLFDHTFIDFVGPIPMSESGNKYIFTATCDLTKFLVAVPTVDCTALTVAKCLLENVICRYNFPSRIISDNATSFNSHVIKQLLRLFQIKKIFSTIYHPQSNVVERSHKTLNAYLRAFTEKNRRQWDELLLYATFVYNNSIHSVTGFTPHELAHGFRIQIPNHLTRTKPTYNYENLSDIVRNKIAGSLDIAKEKLFNQKLKNKSYYDRDASSIDVKRGEFVLMRNQNKKHKFDNVYEGPYEVTDVFDNYIEIKRDRKLIKIHKNLAKPTVANHD